MRVVVLDTETTGINKRRNGDNVCVGHRIVEVGCVEIIDGVISGKIFHSYINPEQAVDSKAVDVHGLADQFLKDKPLFKDIAEGFIEFIKDADLIVIHNATFDVAFIDQEFELLDEKLQPDGVVFKVLDTLDVARGLYPGVKNRLEDLVERFSIKGKDGLHGALEDAKMLAQVYLILEKML